MPENKIRLSQAISEEGGLYMTYEAWKFYQGYIAILLRRLDGDLKPIRKDAIKVISLFPDIIDDSKSQPDDDLITLDAVRIALVTTHILLCHLKNQRRERRACSKNRSNRH